MEKFALTLLALIPICSIALYAGHYLNRGRQKTIFNKLKSHEFTDLTLSFQNAPKVAEIFQKVYYDFNYQKPLLEFTKIDYSRIFRKVLIKGTPLGSCFALLWIGPKTDQISVHIPLSVPMSPFCLISESRLDKFLSRLERKSPKHRVKKDAIQTVNVKQAVPKHQQEFSKFLDKVQEAGIEISCVNSILTLKTHGFSGRTGHLRILEFISIALNTVA